MKGASASTILVTALSASASEVGEPPQCSHRSWAHCCRDWRIAEEVSIVGLRKGWVCVGPLTQLLSEPAVGFLLQDFTYSTRSHPLQTIDNRGTVCYNREDPVLGSTVCAVDGGVRSSSSLRQQPGIVWVIGSIPFSCCWGEPPRIFRAARPFSMAAWTPPGPKALTPRRRRRPRGGQEG